MPIINTVIAGGGTTPTGTKNITTNGTHDVAAYEYADVQVPTTAPTYYKEFVIDANGKVSGGSTVMNFNGITDVANFGFYYLYYYNTNLSGTANFSSLTRISGNSSCYYMFSNCTGLTSANLSSLTTVSGSYGCGSMFEYCTGLISADLSSLTTISGQNCCLGMFNNCTSLTSAVLSSLTTVSGSNCCNNMFQRCTGLTSADLSSLTTVSGSCIGMFGNCTGLTSVDVSSLTTLSWANNLSNMFQNCTNLTSLSFPSITPNSFVGYTNQFNGMCQGITNITLHFPSNTQAKIETLQGYSTTAPFGATAGTVLFDLPATNTLTSADTVTYTRNPKYDTATSLAWKVGAYGTTNFTPAYYTSGTTDPAVGDTMYSDAACTTAVTTISAIA